ncbi:1316_t:CDS:2 [Racocetra fulgida]|uniref:1316_t:CDS:1 n=1 Tax=Racocetra fulgida TaxID=60492 RepID=A0A9N9A9J8_9GLOM|nr:1316_t:CDS:2 [Racocetra fulgida]
MSQSNNWKEIYNSVLSVFNAPELKTELRLTDIKDIEISGCNLFFDLYEHFSNLNITPKTRILRIYADVVQLANTLEITSLNGGGAILIVARRIEIVPKCQLIINYNKSFRIIIYAQEMTSELEIVAKNQLNNNVNTFKFDIDDSKDNKIVGKSLNIFSDKSPEYKDLYIFDIVILKNYLFLKLLRYSLLIANILFYDEPTITRSILSWIYKITELQSGISEEESYQTISELYHKALSMLVQLDTYEERRKNKFSFIPLLDKQFYKTGVDEFMKYVKFYENKYMQVLKKKDEIDEKRTESELLLENSNDKTALYEHLEKIEYQRHVSASNLLEKMENELTYFKVGIEQWKLQKIHDAQIEMLKAVINLAVRVVNIIEAIEKTSISVQDALNAADKVKEFVNDNKDISEKIEEIKQIDENLQTNYNIAEGLNNNVTTEQEKISSLNITEKIHLINFDKFDSLKEEDRKGIKMKPTEEGIEGAADYKDSLTNLFNYINAYIKANNEKEKSFKEYSRIKLQVKMFKRKEERLNKRIEDYKLKKDQCDEYAFSLLECFINIKCWMLTYLENYRCAYKYWSLSESEVMLSAKKTTAKHIKDNIKIRQELESKYHEFGGPPQNSEHTFRLPKNYTKKFKRDKFITYEIPLDYLEFRRFERVRLVNFGVFLNGVGSRDDEISLYISNTNMFSDRYKGKHYHFRLESVKGQGFRYRVSDKKILQNVSFESDIYIIPTPFSQWTIKLDECKIDESMSLCIYGFVFLCNIILLKKLK